MPRRPPIPVLAFLAVAAAVVAVVLTVHGGGRPPAPLPQASGLAAGGPVSHHSFLERVIPPPAEPTSGPAVPRSLTDLANRLPLQRKVAQLFLLGFTGTGRSAPVFGDLSRMDIGGLVVTSENYTDPGQLRRLTALASNVARRARHVPPWLFTIQDGGQFSELSGLPPTDAPSDLHSVQRAAAEATQAAAALHRVGINGVLGPDVDVDTAAGGAYTRLSYSTDPAQVAQYAAATVKAYLHQGMFTAPKHFPGLGAASQPTDNGPAEVGLPMDQLALRDVVPFRAAFQAGSQGVMLGHGLYAPDQFATPASESTSLIGGLLRADLHFGGVAITDDLESAAIRSFQSITDASVAAIKAGADMVYISGPSSDQTAAYAAVLDAARRGQIPTARIDQAVLRILRTKQRLGLISGR